MSGGETIPVFIVMLVVLTSLIFLNLNKPQKKTTKTNESPSFSLVPSSPSFSLVPFSPVSQSPSVQTLQVNVNVTALDLNTLRIASDLVSSLGFFRLTLYNDESLQNPFRYNNYVVAVSISQKNMTDGYVWTNIQPSLTSNKTYWLNIQKTDQYDFGLEDLTKVNFLTPQQQNPNEPSFLDKIETQLRNILNILTPLIQQLVVGELLAMTLKSIFDPNDPDGIAKLLIEGVEKLQDFKKQLTLSRVNFLSKVNLRFNLFLNTLFSLTIDDFIRIAGKIGMYMPNTIKALRIKANRIAERLAATLKNVSLSELKTMTQAMAVRIARGAMAAGKSVAMSLLGPVDLVLLAVAITAAVLDDKNVGNMNDWNKFKTSDFLAMKADLTNAQMEYFRNELNVTFPQINGPLFKYSNKQLNDKIEKIEIDLMFLPSLDSIGPKYEPYVRALSYNDRLPRTQQEIQQIEQLDVMRDLRNMQNRAVTVFYNASRQSPPPNLVTGWYYNIFAINWVKETFLETLNAQKMHKIATYVLCKMEGGVPLHDSQCSYKTPAQCFESYPWPMFRGNFDIPDDTPSEGKSPCASSPCLDDSTTVGTLDFFYSEWRDPNLLKKDYPGGIDYTRDPVTGLCVVVPPGPRITCEAAVKYDPIRRLDTRNNYNMYTGECTNTREYCEAFQKDYVDNMPTSEMANRGTGPLPSCVDADEGAAMIVGGNIMVQYLKAGVTALTIGFESLFGIRDRVAERQAELNRIVNEQKIQRARSDAIQASSFKRGLGLDFLHYNSITLVGLKYDEFSRNFYAMYAKGIEDGVLLLVKYNNRFEIIQTDEWGNVYNDFYFKGPVEKCISSRFALDSFGDVYIIEFFRESFDVWNQRIRKKLGRTGQFTSFEIRVGSIAQQLFTDKQITDAEFNGIFIRNDIIYVTYVAYNSTDNQAISKFLSFDLNGNFIKDVINSKNDYLFRSGYLANEEIFSFVVDDNEHHYAPFNNFDNNYQAIVKFDKSGNSTIINYPSDFQNVPNNQQLFFVKYWTMYPKIHISNRNELIVSNGLKVWNLTQSTSTDITSIVPAEEPQLQQTRLGRGLTTDDPYTLSESAINFWEICNFDMDSDDVIHMFLYRRKYLNINKNRFIKNVITDQVVFPVKDISVDSVELWLDCVKFTNIQFNNCFGIENVKIEITPPPIIKDQEYNKDVTVGKLLLGVTPEGNLYYPLQSNKIIFSPNQSYTITIKLDNGENYRSFTTSLQGVEFDNSVTDYQITNSNGAFCINSDEQKYIIFNKPFRVLKSRILRYKLSGSSSSSPIYGDFDQNNRMIDSRVNIGVRAGQPFNVRIFLEGFENSQYRDFTFIRNLAKIGC